MQPQQGMPLVDPAVGGGSGLKIRNLEGRTVIFVPTRYDPTARGMDSRDQAPRPTVTADVLVLDGGDLYFGDDMVAGTGPTQKVSTPYMARNVVTGNSEIVKALVDLVGKGAALGRVVRGTQGRLPWLFNRLDSDDPVRAFAAQVWGAHSLGQFVNPEPVPLVPQQIYAQPVQQQAYAQAAPQQQAYAQPAQQVQQAYAQAAPQQQAYAQPAQQVQQAYSQQQACPPAELPEVPAGWDPAVWATIPPAQQQAIMAASSTQAPPPF